MTAPASDHALEVVNLKKAFGGLTVTQNVSITVRPGERRLIIGPNGAGKTTLFNQISGDLRPNSGSIRLFGTDITRLPPYKRAHCGLSRTYQIITLFGGDTLEHNVTLGLLGLRSSRWQMWWPLFSYSDLAQEARRILDAVGLLGKAYELASNLSHGEQRNLEIGIALATEPQLLCLDEPTAGMSAAETHETMELVRRIAKNLTILIVEHDMQVVMELASRITVLHYGEVLAEGAPAEIQDNPRVQEVYLKT